MQNLHASVKQDSPSEIGRSFFHYTDVVFVASKDIFVGLDPLEIVSHEGGWMLDTSIKSDADDARRKGVDFFNVPNLDFSEKKLDLSTSTSAKRTCGRELWYRGNRSQSTGNA